MDNFFELMCILTHAYVGKMFGLLQAYAELLKENDIKIPAWFSFNSKDGVHVVSGDSLVECILIAESCKQVAAVGINCTPPRFIHGLLVTIRKVS